jgi:hypothetical protein
MARAVERDCECAILTVSSEKRASGNGGQIRVGQEHEHRDRILMAISIALLQR